MSENLITAFLGKRARRPLGLFIASSVACVFAVNVLAAERDGTLQLSFDVASVWHVLTQKEMLTTLPAPKLLGVERIVAFEDHALFVYSHGTSGPSKHEDSNAAGSVMPGVVRRLIYIRPDTLVIDDQVPTQVAAEIEWTATGPAPLDRSIEGGAKDARQHFVRRLLPETVKQGAAIDANDVDAWGSLPFTTRQSASAPVGWLRFLHVVSLAKSEPTGLPKCSVERTSSGVLLRLVDSVGRAGPSRIIRLWMPDGTANGRIEIEHSDGRKLIPNRLLPAGILPPGLEAAQRRLQWDLPYRVEGRAAWDTKRPSSELRRIVEGGQIKPCRTVEIGCGTGNDAIYLASQGFDVTAIDISPTALNIAARKATKAGVKVDWMLADVLQPPDLDGFDFVYDRGCYHEIRQHHAEDYVAAVRKLARDEAKILILAGNANKDSYWRFHGPPRVTEQAIRQDFSAGFQLLQLREFRFDPAPPEREGALAWSIFLERAAGRRSDGEMP